MICIIKHQQLFSGPLGVLRGEGEVGEVLMGLGTRGGGESSDGGGGKEQRLSVSKGPHLLSWGGWGLFPVISSVPLLPRMVSAASQASFVDTMGWGEWCREAPAMYREG